MQDVEFKYLDPFATQYLPKNIIPQRESSSNGGNLVLNNKDGHRKPLYDYYTKREPGEQNRRIPIFRKENNKLSSLSAKCQ